MYFACSDFFSSKFCAARFRTGVSELEAAFSEGKADRIIFAICILNFGEKRLKKRDLMPPQKTLSSSVYL